jgi:HSP20 family molecular chaperone IbpA
LSARWRRSRKKREWFGLESFCDARKGAARRALDMDGWITKRRPYGGGREVRRIRLEGRMREPEPLLDVLEGRKDIIVVAEFAGFNKENLEISVDKHRLTLCAQALDRRYYKSLNLPKRVIPNTIRTSCKNGVLEIQLKKAAQRKALGRVAD